MTSGSWSPINDNHAIYAMAAVLSFAEPIPTRLLMGAIEAAEPVAFDMGLRSRHSAITQSFQIAIAEDGRGAPPQISPASAPGRTYNALVETADGQLSTQVSEQLQLLPHTFVYRTWNYVSWKWQYERMRKLLEPALSAALSAVAISVARLEYMDRFYFDGPVSDADARQLLRAQSPFVAPHVYETSDQWHVHTGAFLGTPNPPSLLLQINMDAVNQPRPDDTSGEQIRWLNIMTALEKRSQGQEDSWSTNVADALGSFDELHEPLKNHLTEIISDEMAQRIYLNG